MKTITDIRDMQRHADAVRAAGRRIGLVPTMGHLHEGHLSLVRLAREQADDVVVSIFVNPIQFDRADDFEAYPRDRERDAGLLEREGVDAIFQPDVSEVYPEGFQTRVEVSELSKPLCGAFRPGHFAGVTTVVTKLLLAVKPHVAVFGQKDFQQLQVIRRMVRDLGFDVEIVQGALVREADGLAMSSRNARLSRDQRDRALAIHRGLGAVQALVRSGVHDRESLEKEFRLQAERSGLEVEYAELRHPETLAPAERIEGSAVFAVAAWVGDVRLIDNTLLESGAAPAAPAAKSARRGQKRYEPMMRSEP